MSEYEYLNLFYIFLISNAMYFVGFAIFTWLGLGLQMQFIKGMPVIMCWKDLYNCLLCIGCSGAHKL